MTGANPFVLGEHDERTIVQIRQVAEHPKVVASALMADGHLGYGMPIGGVVAYEDAVSPEGVGFDIGCGNKAVRTDVCWTDFKTDLVRVMDQIFEQVAFGVGQASGQYRDHPVFEREEWAAFRDLKELARQQLGSVGSGNHYVDLMVDDQGQVWVGVHFGSRGLGHKIASRYMTDGDMMKRITVIDLSTERGIDYWAGMTLAGAYAQFGRDCVVEQVLGIIGAHPTFEVQNHHNYAWKERHFDTDVVVVRKGATPAFPDQQGFVGGSMGDNAVILHGKDSEISPGTLYSTIHGAGRVMSRTAARGKINRKTGQVKVPGAVSPKMMRDWLDSRGVVLRGGDLDEAPQAYRRLPAVLQAQGDTISIDHSLRPVGVAMAGARDFDPYKD
jgi:tRNA-splicing ligase RtcB